MGKLTDTTPDRITTAREALDKAYEVCRNLGGTDESDFHAIATVFDLVEKLKAERDEQKRRADQLLIAANFHEDADPDFSEAAYYYAESVTEDFIKLFPSIASPVQPDPITANQVIEFMERETGLPFGDFIGMADCERIKAMALSIGDK